MKKVWVKRKTARASFSREKFEQCVLFFLERINNVHLGRTKLMKLLYYVDFDHYEKYGRPVTGATYRKLPLGPVPDEAAPTISAMVRAKHVQEIHARRAGYSQHRLMTLSATFDPSIFSGDEVETLEKVAAAWEHETASGIEAASHREAPWAATKDGDVIVYELAHFRHPVGSEPLDERLAKSKRLAQYVAALRNA